MKNLPIPSTISGWYLGLLLVVLSFIMYYVCMFEKIYETYYEKIYPNITPREYLIGDNKLLVELTLPKSLAYFDTGEFIVTLSSEKQVGEVEVTIEADGLLLCSEHLLIDCVKTKKNTIRFDALASGEKQTHALWATVEPGYGMKTITPTLTVRQGNQLLDAVPTADTSTLQISVDNGLPLLSAFLRTLLLPPWSNGFIPASALMFTALIENEIQSKQRLRRVEDCPLLKQLRKWLHEIVNTLFAWIPVIVLCRVEDCSLLKRLRKRLHEIVNTLFAWIPVIVLYFSLFSTLYNFLIGNVLWIILCFISFFIIYCVWVIRDDTDQSIHNALTQINTTLESSAKTTMVEASTHNQQMKALTDSLDKMTEKLEEKLGALISSQQQILQHFSQHVQDLLNKFQAVTVNRSPILDYSFNHLSLFNDSGLANMFRKELSALSSDQFQKKLTDQQFTFCILSLFVLDCEKKWDDDILIDNKSLRSWMQKHSFWENLFEGWLDDLAKASKGEDKDSLFARSVDAIVKWMLHLEADWVERYIFDVLPHKCSPQSMVSIFSDYQDIYRSSGRLSDIKWEKVLNYFVQFPPETPLPEDTPIEKVWYPELSSSDSQITARTSQSLWKIVSQEKPLAEKEQEQLYTGILKWLCAIPIELVELAQRVADDICQFYNNDSPLPKDSYLERFVQSYKTRGNSSFDKFIQQWCNNKAKPQTGMNSSRQRKRR